jgi:hypothetical protein
MTKDETLRLALEALEYPGPSWIEARQPAITAIKAALEAKDEPVSQPKVRTGNCLRVGVCASEGHKIQPQRTWAGLTDEDRLELAKAQHGWEDLLIAAEAKLKEKNT